MRTDIDIQREVAERVPFNIDVRELRRGLGMSQTTFAVRFGFSLSTLRCWEQGQRFPVGSARVLLQTINFAPDIVIRALDHYEQQRASGLVALTATFHPAKPC